MQDPYIIGDKLYLRPIEIEDRDRYVTWLNDVDVRSGIGRTHPLNHLAQEEFLKTYYKKETQMILAIVDKKNGHAYRRNRPS